MESLNNNGVSTCTELGQEKYLYFNLAFRPRKRGRYCQYDYRHTDGELFSTCAPTLEICRERRDEWLNTKSKTR